MQPPKLKRSVYKLGQPTAHFKKSMSKTVYDPQVISDDKILELGQQAATKCLNQSVANGDSQFSEVAGGIKFRIYIDTNTKEIKNFHPEF